MKVKFAALLLILAATTVNAQTVIHKCRGADGSLVMQDNPCGDHDIAISNWMAHHGNPPSYKGQEITLNFSTAPLGKILNIIAYVAGNYELYLDDSGQIATNISVAGEPWDQVLHDIDVRYGLHTTFANGKMYVQRAQQQSAPVANADDAAYDAAETYYEKRFPVIAPGSPQYDQKVVDLIKSRMGAYLKSHPSASQTDALEKTVTATLGH